MANAFGFDHFSQYFDSLKHTPQLLKERWNMKKTTAGADADKAEGGAELKKTLGPIDLMAMGVGLIIGAGVFTSTGAATATLAGPAIVISYMIAGLSALLSSAIYSEFAVEFPLAGGAFNYIMITCGELLAWLVVATLLLEYVLANAAVARSFSPYLASLFNKSTHYFQFEVDGGNLIIDPLAAALVLMWTAVLCFGAKESALVNNILTVIHLGLIFMIIIVGFVYADTANMTPFMPYGYKGIFDAAAWVFFAFIGFDAVACAAEEVKKVERDMPIGTVGAIVVVTIIYILLSLSLVISVPLGYIDEDAAFVLQMDYVGLSWMKYIVAGGALLGIATGVLIGSMAVARILTAVARDHMVPPVLAKVSPKRGTPWVSQVTLGVVTAVIALFTAFDSLVNMISAGTLWVFAVVGLALLWKRYYNPGVTSKGPVLLHIGLLMIVSIAFALCYAYVDSWIPLPIFFIISLLIGFLMKLQLKDTRKPKYSTFFFPYTPCVSVLLNSFLMASLPGTAYWQFALFLGVVLVIYVLYSIHLCNYKDQKDHALGPRTSPSSFVQSKDPEEFTVSIPSESKTGPTKDVEVVG